MMNEPNRLDNLIWPDNVTIFYPTDEIKLIKETIWPYEDGPIKKYMEESNTDTRFTYTSGKYFSTNHHAFLFAPGEYKNCDFEVGYYVQVVGLGASADDVRFTGNKSGPFVESLDKNLPYVESDTTIERSGAGLSLDTVWRSAENFSIKAEQGLMWAVSQGAPLRRVSVDAGDLHLWDSGFASGGFIANVHVEHKIFLGGQQQYFGRHLELARSAIDPFEPTVNGDGFSVVLTGCTGEGVPNDTSGGTNTKSVVIEETPKVRVEKPFIVLNDKKRWELHVPNPHFDDDSVTGPHLSVLSPKEIRSFTSVKVVGPRIHSKDVFDVFRYNTIDDADMRKTEEMQTALDEGKDLIICPGEYFLNRSLVVKNSDQVILGLGLPSLIAPQDGSPCIRVIANTPGVRIAGLMIEASMLKLTPTTGTKNADGVKSLIDFGESDVEDDGDEQNPGVLSDIFTRVGGSNLNRNNVTTDVMVRIHSGNVIGDNLWLWHADRVRLGIDEGPNNSRLFPLYHHVQEGECRVKTALEVNGNDVKMYGLFCEYTTENQMVWKGSNGSAVLLDGKGGIEKKVLHNEGKDVDEENKYPGFVELGMPYSFGRNLSNDSFIFGSKVMFGSKEN